MLDVDEQGRMALRMIPYVSAACVGLLLELSRGRRHRAPPQPEWTSFNNFGIDPETLEGRTNMGLRWSPPRPWEMGLKKQAAQARQSGVEASVRGFEEGWPRRREWPSGVR